MPSTYACDLQDQVCVRTVAVRQRLAHADRCYSGRDGCYWLRDGRVVAQGVVGRTWLVASLRAAADKYRGGESCTELHAILIWDRLASIRTQFMVKGVGGVRPAWRDSVRDLTRRMVRTGN